MHATVVGLLTHCTRMLLHYISNLLCGMNKTTSRDFVLQ